MDYANQQKALLNQVIDNACINRRDLLSNLDKDFIRDRKLPLKTMLQIIISMQGGSINSELYDYAYFLQTTATLNNPVNGYSNIQNMLSYSVTEAASNDYYLSLEKSSATTVKPSMEGIKYGIYDNNNNLFFTFVLGQNGRVASVTTQGSNWSNANYTYIGVETINTRKYAHFRSTTQSNIGAGTFKIKETATNANYKANTNSASVPALTPGQDNRKTIAAQWAGINGALTNANIDSVLTDRPYYAVGIHKVDENGNALSGAKFEFRGSDTDVNITGSTTAAQLGDLLTIGGQSEFTTDNNGWIKLDVTDVYDPDNRVSGYKYIYAWEKSAPNDNYLVTARAKKLTVWNKKAADLTVSDTMTFTNPHAVYVTLTKASSNPSCTNGNDNYSLDGTTYDLYTSQQNASNKTNSIHTFTIAENGTTTAWKIPVQYLTYNAQSGNLIPTTFYLRETAVGKGYKLSNTITAVTVTAANVQGSPASVNVTDMPIQDPLDIEVIKAFNDGTLRRLAGAEFTTDNNGWIKLDVTDVYDCKNW